jgi:integrase
MPGLRRKGNIWHIEKRCRYVPGGWLRCSTGTASRAEAERILIRHLADVIEKAKRHTDAVFLFEEAAFRYVEDVAEKPSADAIAMHLDQVLPFIGDLPMVQVHDGTLRPFIEHELARGLSAKSINNALGVVSRVLKQASEVWRDDLGRAWLAQTPARITQLSLKGRQAKAYPLSWTEQHRLLELLPRHLADAATFGINTGCREQEICRLRWDWEFPVPELEASVFVLPEPVTKTWTERVVVLNSVARRVIDSRRGRHEKFVFSYRGRRLSKLHSSAWKRAWRTAGLPVERDIRKGVHNLRYTFGRRLRSAGVPLETRKALLGHSNGDLTTHYSPAEIEELQKAAERIVDERIGQTPTLMLVRKRSNVGRSVGKSKKG